VLPPHPIAVVDDNEMGRYVVSRALRAAGLNVMEAASGSAALELLDAPSPRLYLLDMLLPDIDGFEVCKSIKKARPETIVLPVTAVYRSAGHRDRALEVGAAGFLTRPIATDVLVRTVSALVRAA
jgi:CheY-like chemotaxis protein